MPLPSISPPLVNSANPWATSLEDLQALFDCPFTGAVTTRTSLLEGFEHDADIHQYAFFDPQDHSTRQINGNDKQVAPLFGGSLNTLGYSPISLETYLQYVQHIAVNSKLPHAIREKKPFIVSVTGSPDAVLKCYRLIRGAQLHVANPLCMEINLSCPNIPNRPPPAYSRELLLEYLSAISKERAADKRSSVRVGIKTPPYTYHDQFQILVEALHAAGSADSAAVDFVTATNTLGGCLILDRLSNTPLLGSLSGTGIGGMAGTPLHPLALGNVKMIRKMLDQYSNLGNIEIIGVGGVDDKASYNRMRAVGATVVGVGTALGREGVGVFEKILQP